MTRVLTLVLVACGVLLSDQGVSYTRYFRNEKDFLRGVSMLATERPGVPHIRALYDRQDRILSKQTMDGEGDLVQEEIYEYDPAGNLTKRSVRDSEGHVEKHYVYGDQEAMSRTFIDAAFPHRDPREFRDRITITSYGPGGEVERIRFFSVDHTELGSIAYLYFDSGLVKEDRWVREPGGKTIRLFRYDYDPGTRAYELTERDSTGAVVSHVGLVLPAGPGHREPLPGTTEEGTAGGVNILEESGEIIKDIRLRKAEGWDPARELGALVYEDIQHSPDVIYLRNGDTLEVDLLQITDRFVRFKQFGGEDILTLPLSAVGEIERRDGKIVYPTLY